jgi:ATP-dependent DNA helicase RecG
MAAASARKSAAATEWNPTAAKEDGAPAGGIFLLTLQDEVTEIRGVGPRRAQMLAKAGIITVDDLLLNLPFRYEDRSAAATIAELEPGTPVTVRAKVKTCRAVRGQRWRVRVEAKVEDETGQLRVVWFNQPYIANSATVGTDVWLYGSVTMHKDELQMVNPVLEVAAPVGDSGDSGDGDGESRDGDSAAEEVAPLHVGRLVPVYRRIGDLGPGLLRRLIAVVLSSELSIDENLPTGTRQHFDLMDREQALREIHDPPEDAEPEVWNASRSSAHMRLIFEEFLAFQTTLLMQRPEQEDGKAGEARVDKALREHDLTLALLQDAKGEVLAALPFVLTEGQGRALDLILEDMARPQPMHRLLQGDVGCGKTAVAASAMLLTALGGRQAALLVPTEILAVQQARTLRAQAAHFGLEVACITASQPSAERRAVEAAVAAGDIHLVVGTHAILQERVQFADLALAVVDEQHRFGVRQRAALREKGEVPGARAAKGTRGEQTSREETIHEAAGRRFPPDLLVMTATPIPRSLALTIYGDLDLCTIPDLPPGRQPIQTEVVADERWPEIVERLREAMARGEQAYVVAPRIDPDTEGESELRDAVTLRAELHKALGGSVGLLHGSLDSEEKSSAMAAFVSGQTGVLVATTVVEVGVDVPNATLMVVQHAERFGLAQLHQLRGRVGRGAVASQCVLVGHPPLTPVARARLVAVRDHHDGFELAEQDLVLRGPGEVLGTRQAGAMGLRLGDPVRDHDWLVAAREEAARLLDSEAAEARAFCFRVKESWWRSLSLLRAG